MECFKNGDGIDIQAQGDDNCYNCGADLGITAKKQTGPAAVVLISFGDVVDWLYDLMQGQVSAGGPDDLDGDVEVVIVDLDDLRWQVRVQSLQGHWLGEWSVALDDDSRISVPGYDMMFEVLYAAVDELEAS